MVYEVEHCCARHIMKYLLRIGPRHHQAAWYGSNDNPSLDRLGSVPLRRVALGIPICGMAPPGHVCTPTPPPYPQKHSVLGKQCPRADDSWVIGIVTDLSRAGRAPGFNTTMRPDSARTTRRAARPPRAGGRSAKSPAIRSPGCALVSFARYYKYVREDLPDCCILHNADLIPLVLLL